MKRPPTNAVAIQSVFDATNVVVPVRSFRRAKKELGFQSRVRPKKLYLTAAHAKARVSHAKRTMSMTPADWGLVAFSDETQGTAMPPRWQIVKSGTCPDKACTWKNPVKVMFWGCISSQGPVEHAVHTDDHSGH
jgi:hypothetical protein